MTRRTLCVLLITIALGYFPRSTQAQVNSYDVFASSSTATSKSSVYFVDARTGLSTVAVTNGDNPTLLGSTVIFTDHQTGKIGMASPDGTVALQPFMVAADTTTPNTTSTTDTFMWAVSADRNWITWATAHSESGSLLTDLYVAGADGSNKQLILHTSSSKGVGVRPLSISNDGASVFYTRQADDPKSNHAYSYASDIFRMTVATGVPSQPNGEPRCACAAAFSADGHLFFRLETNLTAHFSDLSVNADSSLPPPVTPFIQAGDALFADKGTMALYSVAKGTTPEQYALILADAGKQQQRVIVPPSANHLRPVAFEGGVVILTGVDKDGTYKLWLSDGTLTQVSAYTYLGTINHP